MCVFLFPLMHFGLFKQDFKSCSHCDSRYQGQLQLNTPNATSMTKTKTFCDRDAIVIEAPSSVFTHQVYLTVILRDIKNCNANTT